MLTTFCTLALEDTLTCCNGERYRRCQQACDQQRARYHEAFLKVTLRLEGLFTLLVLLLNESYMLAGIGVEGVPEVGKEASQAPRYPPTRVPRVVVPG